MIVKWYLKKINYMNFIKLKNNNIEMKMGNPIQRMIALDKLKGV